VAERPLPETSVPTISLFNTASIFRPAFFASET
jgi:hypothetical protein